MRAEKRRLKPQRALRACLHAAEAEDTFRRVRRGIDANIHGTYLRAPAAGDALFAIHPHTEKSKAACQPEKDRHGADVFAERPVVPALIGQGNARSVIGEVSGNEAPPHDLLQLRNMQQEQRPDIRERRAKDDIAHEAPAPPRSLRRFEWQQVEHHGCPAGIAAPAAPENKRAEELGDGIVYDRCLKNAQEEIVPEALYLHILPADEAQVHEHIQADGKLHDVTGVPPPRRVQGEAQGESCADIAEVEEVKDLPQRQPERDGHSLKQQPHSQGRQILLHGGAIPPRLCRPGIRRTRAPNRAGRPHLSLAGRGRDCRRL